MALTANFALNINWSLSKSLDLSEPKDSKALSRGPSFTNGTGANQADAIWHDKRTLGDGANETLDLASQTDGLGTAITISKLKALYIKNKSSDANLKIGAAAATPVALFADAASDILLLPPGGEFLFTAPNATGLDISTNSNLKLEHDGTGESSLDYEIIAAGVD